MKFKIMIRNKMMKKKKFQVWKSNWFNRKKCMTIYLKLLKNKMKS